MSLIHLCIFFIGDFNPDLSFVKLISCCCVSLSSAPEISQHDPLCVVTAFCYHQRDPLCVVTVCCCHQHDPLCVVTAFCCHQHDPLCVVTVINMTHCVLTAVNMTHCVLLLSST